MLVLASAAKSSIPWANIGPFIIIELSLDLVCVLDMLRHGGVRRLPRWAWMVLALLTNPLGGIAYLLFGRERASLTAASQ
jgi:Phospholipase_D-nuclease N-terminal